MTATEAGPVERTARLEEQERTWMSLCRSWLSRLVDLWDIEGRPHIHPSDAPELFEGGARRSLWDDLEWHERTAIRWGLKNCRPEAVNLIYAWGSVQAFREAIR